MGAAVRAQVCSKLPGHLGTLLHPRETQGCPVERALRTSNALPTDLGCTSSGRRRGPSEASASKVTRRGVRF